MWSIPWGSNILTPIYAAKHYREVRRLENEALIASLTQGGTLQRELDIRALAQVDVDQFYGLELNEWAVRIAEVGLWLTDHQANVELAEALGQTYRRLPLRASPTVRIDNALRVDWRRLLPPSRDVLVLGNPPFVGKKERDQSQRKDMDHVWADISGSGNLDYVTCWYRKAVDYIQGILASVVRSFQQTASHRENRQEFSGAPSSAAPRSRSSSPIERSRGSVRPEARLTFTW